VSKETFKKLNLIKNILKGFRGKLSPSFSKLERFNNVDKYFYFSKVKSVNKYLQNLFLRSNLQTNRFYN